MNISQLNIIRFIVISIYFTKKLGITILGSGNNKHHQRTITSYFLLTSNSLTIWFSFDVLLSPFFVLSAVHLPKHSFLQLMHTKY